MSAATGLVRRLERLGWSAALARSTETACSTSTTGAGFGFGFGLDDALKPISPNRGATTAAREGTAVETATASSAGLRQRRARRPAWPAASAATRTPGG